MALQEFATREQKAKFKIPNPPPLQGVWPSEGLLMPGIAAKYLSTDPPRVLVTKSIMLAQWFLVRGMIMERP